MRQEWAVVQAVEVMWGINTISQYGSRHTNTGMSSEVMRMIGHFGFFNALGGLKQSQKCPNAWHSCTISYLRKGGEKKGGSYSINALSARKLLPHV